MNLNRFFFFLFSIFVFLMAGCGKDDESETVDRPVETIQKGYFKTPVYQQDIDNTFLKYGIIGEKSMSLYRDRWCAFIGDSITIFIAKDIVGFGNDVFVNVVVNDTRYSFCQINCFREKQDDLFRLVEDKPIVHLRNILIIPVRNQNGTDDYFCYTSEGSAGTIPGCFDYVLDYDRGVIVFHKDDGNYYLWEMFTGKDPQRYYPEQE